ncbi:unnamed protein product, partial [Penicillium discolor]
MVGELPDRHQDDVDELPIQVLALLPRPVELGEGGQGIVDRDDERLDVEELSLIPRPHGDITDPGQGPEVVEHGVGVGVGLLVVERRRTGVHEIGDRGAGVAPPVPEDTARDESRGRRVRPPQPEADSADSDDRSGRGHPVGLVHVRIGVEDLVVQVLRQAHLDATEVDRQRDGQGHHAHHQPPRPDHVAEHLHGTDRRPIPAHQPDDGIDQEESTHGEQGDAGHEVGHADRAEEP